MGDASEGCGGEVELCTVGITVETEAMSVKCLAEGEHVEDEEKRG